MLSLSISKKTQVTKARAQSEAFIEAARELGCDDDPTHFDEVLKKVAWHKPADDGALPAPSDEDKLNPNKIAK